MFKKLSTLLVASTLMLSGCVTPPPPQKSALELQAIQVKEFETSHKVAFTAVRCVTCLGSWQLD